MGYVKLAVVLSAVAGLVVLDYREHQHTRQRIDELASIVAKTEQPAPVTPPDIKVPPAGAIPRELDHITLPPYIIESPDQLIIEVTVRDSKTKTMSRLPVQPITGAFLVRPDGTVGLGYWGSVLIAGLTVQQAADVVQKHLAGTETWKTEADGSEPPVVILNVLAKNSKRYYVITAVDGGEQVYPFPQTGTETVLDALTRVNVLSAVATAGSVCVKRRTPIGEQTLPVDWAAITERGVTTTNYQLLSGDRIFVALGK